MKPITKKMSKSDKGFHLEINEIQCGIIEWVNEIMDEIEKEGEN